MLALVSSFIFLLAEGGGSSTNTWEEVRAFWDHYLNYPGFELWKFINLFLFVAIMVYLVRKPLSDAFKAKFGAEPAEAALTSLQTADGSHSKAALFHPQAPQIFDAFAIATNEIVTQNRDAKEALTAAAERANAAIRG